jgi:cytochrome c-type biogenesis protein CcmH/NrfG
VIARAGIVVAALLVAVWLASGLRPVRDEAAGLAAVRSDTGRAYELPERAAQRTRSTGPDVRLAQLDAFTERPDRAVRRLKSVVRREPENHEAWVLLAQNARTVEPALAARAMARARALSPPVGR